ncbi:MAG: DUF996 domain-containing protein [Thaumarchaeota archaeon]|nr:DUF996 domain-containing protein [Nitrososphaerota archaeon]
MSKLSEAKTYGGVGSILMLLAIVPSVGWLLAIVGAILVLVAIKRVSEVVADPSIFNNMLIAIVLGIAGIVVGVVVIAASVFSAFGLTALTQMAPGSVPSIAQTDIVKLITGIVAGLAVVWILLLVAAIFVRKSYGSMATKLGVGMFSTSGLIFLIGAALTIVLVGFILIFVSEILNIIAFFSIPEQLPMASPTMAPAPSA